MILNQMMTYNSILYITICAVVYGLLKKKKPENNRVKIKIKIKGKPEDIKKIGLDKELNKRLNNNLDNLSNYKDEQVSDTEKGNDFEEISKNKDLRATFNTLSHEEKLKLIDPSIWN